MNSDSVVPRWLSLVEQRFRKPTEKSKKGLDWDSFREYLTKKHSRVHANDVFNYSMKYCSCLLREDFSELCGLSVSKRRHVLIALSNLSKFLGMYEVFKRLLKEYGLKWETVKAEDLLISRMTKTEDNGEVLKWIDEVKARFPEFSDFLDFTLFSGLRFVEAVSAYNLIIDLTKEGRLTEYFNREQEALEHFRFKQLFLRNKKKAFLSFVPNQLIERISKNKKFTIYQIRNRIRRSNFGLRFGDMREYFATYMTKFLTQPEIDFLQGRVSASVFMRNYFNPALISDLKTRVFTGIAVLKG